MMLVFYPHATAREIAYALNRLRSIFSDADILLTTHEGEVSIKCPSALSGSETVRGCTSQGLAHIVWRER